MPSLSAYSLTGVSLTLDVGYLFTAAAAKCSLWASQIAQPVKNLPAMQKTWVQSLGWEDPLEKGNATHSIILAWRMPWTV